MKKELPLKFRIDVVRSEYVNELYSMLYAHYRYNLNRSFTTEQLLQQLNHLLEKYFFHGGLISEDIEHHRYSDNYSGWIHEFSATIDEFCGSIDSLNIDYSLLRIEVLDNRGLVLLYVRI